MRWLWIATAVVVGGSAAFAMSQPKPDPIQAAFLEGHNYAYEELKGMPDRIALNLYHERWSECLDVAEVVNQAEPEQVTPDVAAVLGACLALHRHVIKRKLINEA